MRNPPIGRVVLVLVGDPAPGSKAGELMAADREVEKLLALEDGEAAVHSPRRFRWGLNGVEDLLMMPLLIEPGGRNEAEGRYRRLGWRRVVFLGPLVAEDLRGEEERVGDAGKAPA